MRMLTNRPRWQNEPLRLTEDDKKDLHHLLDEFFSCYHLQDVRQMLWDWLVVALSSDKGDYASGIDRNNLIHFYEKLEILAETAYLLRKPCNKEAATIQELVPES